MIAQLRETLQNVESILSGPLRETPYLYERIQEALDLSRPWNRVGLVLDDTLFRIWIGPDRLLYASVNVGRPLPITFRNRDHLVQFFEVLNAGQEFIDSVREGVLAALEKIGDPEGQKTGN